MIAAVAEKPVGAAMTPAEMRAYRAGVEAVRGFAQSRVADHQARVRRAPNRPWTVTIGLLGGFGRVIDHCDALLAEQNAEGRT